MLPTMPFLVTTALLGLPIVEEGKPRAALAPLAPLNASSWSNGRTRPASGLPRRVDARNRLPAGGTPDWTRLCVIVEVPPKAAQLVFCVSAYNQGPEDVLQADDASLQCIPQ